MFKYVLPLLLNFILLKSIWNHNNSDWSFSHCRSQIQEPTEEELLCELRKHPHLELNEWHLSTQGFFFYLLWLSCDCCKVTFGRHTEVFLVYIVVIWLCGGVILLNSKGGICYLKFSWVPVSHQVVKKGTCRLELSESLNCTLESEHQKLFVRVLICVHETVLAIEKYI